MSDRAPTLSEVIDSAIARGVALVRVGLPARVETYDGDLQLASVKPLLKDRHEQEDGEEALVSLPIISDVPVIFPGGDGCRVLFDLVKGDEVWLTFSDRSLDKYLSVGGEVDPGDLRRHHLSDAVAFPGMHSTRRALEALAAGARMMIGREGGHHISIHDDGIRIGEDAAQALVQGTAFKAALDTFLTALAAATPAVAVACGTLQAAAYLSAHKTE